MGQHGKEVIWDMRHREKKEKEGEVKDGEEERSDGRETLKKEEHK